MGIGEEMSQQWIKVPLPFYCLVGLHEGIAQTANSVHVYGMQFGAGLVRPGVEDFVTVLLVHEFLDQFSPADQHRGLTGAKLVDEAIANVVGNP